MSRIVLAVLISLLWFGPAVDSAGQTRKTDSAEVLKQLLARPAATPRHTATPVPTELAHPRPPNFYHRDNAPPDDAPTADLIDYWRGWAGSERDPTEPVKKRLLDACVADPEILATFLDILPQAESTTAKIKNIYDEAQTNSRFDQSWRTKVRKWLVFNSTYFLDELVSMAHKVKDNQNDGDVDKEDALVALAKLSWTNAEPLLRGLMAAGQPRATALALSLFYEHAIEEKDLANEERYRRDLQAIAANRNQPAYARDQAIESLSSSEWSGRDDWYIGLFQDETLLEPSDGEYELSPLITLFNSDRKKWIPIMVRLLDSEDINVRTAAASCLLTADNEDDKELVKTALRPLLPWLTNPAWLNDTSSRRVRLIQSLGNINIPDSVPGLISVLDQDESDPAFARSGAAQSLALYKDARATPALKRALEKEKDEIHRHRIIKALLASKALTDEEQLEALEAYASRLASPEGRADMMRFRSPQEDLGKYLNYSTEAPSESLVNAVLARVEELKSENPALAGALVEIVHRWQGEQVELDIIRRIANGSADSKTIGEALQRKEKMQEGLRTELEALASVPGAAQGIGAVVLNNAALAQDILTSDDQPAQIALLACSRLTQTSLPVELIGPFLRHKDPLLTLAAEAYLLAEDSREARDLLWQHHPNEAFVTGWRENLRYGSDYEPLVKSEDKLRAELFKENGPIEIVAFISNMNQGQVLRIYPDKAVYTEYEDAARYRERTVPKAEVAALKDFLSLRDFAERGPTLSFCHHGCSTRELLLLTKEKGRRVFMQSGDVEWIQLQEQFAQLAAGDGAKIHYKLEEEIKGLQVLYDGDLTVGDASKQGNQLRIFVERPATKEEEAERQATYEVDDEDDEALKLQLTRRRVQLTNARFSWRVFAGDKVGEVTSAPDSYSTIDPSKFITGDENDVSWEDVEMKPLVLDPDAIIFVQNYAGLWRQFASSKPVRLGSEDASYSNPVATRDGKWVVVSKTDDEGNEPTYVVRLNMQTGREYRVDLQAADQLTPVAFLPSLGKVLVKRARSEYAFPGATTKGPPRPGHLLLDPASGATRVVAGEFAPLYHTGNRFLQPTENPDEFWAAIIYGEKSQTQIGRYSVKDFSFKPFMVVPQIMFDSRSMWVDEAQKKVYVVYKGQLLRLPLQANAK